MTKCFEFERIAPQRCSRSHTDQCDNFCILQAIHNYKTLKKGDVVKICSNHKSSCIDEERTFLGYSRKGLMILDREDSDNWYVCHFKKVEKEVTNEL